MNERELDPFAADELKLIDSARRGLEPSAEDAARVLNGARLAIAAGLPLSTPNGPTLEPSTLAASSKLAALAPKLLAALVIAGVSAGIGYKLGVREGAQQAGARSLPSTASVTESAQVSGIAPTSALPRAQAPVVANALPVPVSIETIPSAVPDAGITSARMRARRTKPVVAELAASAAPQAQVATDDEPIAMQSLDPEVRALKQIERALRRREPERALTLLQQLDRQVPSGKLTEERAAAFAMARCDLGIGTPMAHALEFSQRYPASVYFARVRQTCTPATDSGVR